MTSGEPVINARRRRDTRSHRYLRRRTNQCALHFHCGGRTEDSENIFNDVVPYLRGRECAAEGAAAFKPFMIKTKREPADLHSESNVTLARDVSLLAIQNVNTVPTRVSDSWLADEASVSEVRNWLANAARLALIKPSPYRHGRR
mgnify:CR=1 FL=1